MMFSGLLIIGMGGFVGSITRYGISKYLNRPKNIPTGTLTVNLTGALLIGLVFGLELPQFWTFFFAAGLAGALTTFSTLNKELIDLWQFEKKKEAVLYLLITYIGGGGLAVTGYWITSYT